MPVGLFVITCTGWQPLAEEELSILGRIWVFFLYSSFTFVVHQLCSPPALPETRVFQVYVLKRPHVDEFLQKMGELFECVLFTASLAKVFPFLLWIFVAGRTAFCVSWLCSAFALSPSEFSHFLSPSLSICV